MQKVSAARKEGWKDWKEGWKEGWEDWKEGWKEEDWKKGWEAWAELTGVGIAGPFVEDALADDGELHGFAILGGIQDFVSADGHRHHLGLESGCDLGHFDSSGDSLVGFHVEALNCVGPIDLGEESWMEGDDDCCANKDTLWIEGSFSLDSAFVEWQTDLSDGLVVRSVCSAALGFLVEQSLDVGVAAEGLLGVECDLDRCRSAFDLRITGDSVVNRCCQDCNQQTAQCNQ